MNRKDWALKVVTLLAATFVFAVDAQGGNLAIDGAGNLFVQERGSDSILKIMPDGTESAFATGLTSYDMAFDPAGNLFVTVLVSGHYGHSILKFTSQGVKSTFASGLSTIGLPSLAFDRAGNLFVSDYESHSILKFTPEGVKSTFISELNDPAAVAVDGTGNLFVSEEGDPQSILKITPDGVRSAFATFKGNVVHGLVCDGTGNLFVLEVGIGSILKITPDGTKRTVANVLADGDIAVDPSGNLFVHDNVSNSILKITPDGTQSTFASAGVSPDKKWKYQCDEVSAEIVKAGTTQVVVDLSNDHSVVHSREATVVWAPDSKRFAFNYSPPHASHTSYETIAFYQLHDGKWLELRSPVDETSERTQLAQLARQHLPKTDPNEDILKVLNWVDANTATLYARSVWSRNGAEANFLFTLKFDAKGNSKIVKTHQMSDKEVDELNK